MNTCSTTPAKVGFVSLGCPKALVDSERILTQLRSEGYDVARDYADADLVVINTCGFIDAAIEESMDTIGEALQENGKVIVTGCLGQDSQRILERYPQVLGVSGAHDYETVMQHVHAHLPQPHDPFQDLLPAQGIKLTPPHYAYLKISEGCNHRCSFCIIPGMRGDLVSRPVESVLQEAETLVENGVKELLVVSQDTSAYGVDTKYKPGIWKGNLIRSHIQELATALGELPAWIRFHYVYPYPHVDKLIPLMSEGHILPYLDIPFQHASPSVLKNMRRPAHAEKVLHRISAWREQCPDMTVRSTFITGFPGETEDDFETLLSFIREANINRAGCFTYSPVEGAAANDLPDHIPEELKLERQARFMQVQQEISAQLLQQNIGKKIVVLTDDTGDGHTLARSSGDAPEIDGEVIIEGVELEPGQFCEVEITASSEHDLQARLTSEAV